jgi:lysophospholipase L1-like esterase
MRTIVCFGDSNTWGDPPGGSGRFDWNTRWTGILQDALGTGFRVIEEGLPGRTTCFDDPFSPCRNGLSYLTVALETHSPLDLLTIMLGTNDLKANFNLSAFDISRGAESLLVVAKNFRPEIEHILLVSPPHVVNTDDLSILQQFPDGVAKSRSLSAHYQRFAELHGCHFFDAASVAEASPIDGIHLDARNHKCLADGLAEKILTIFE